MRPKLLIVFAALALMAAACTPANGAGPLGKGSRAVLRVVAAENTWGSLAAQLGGKQVQVTSILSDPNADPHEYETSATDARAFALANVVIENGAGYDGWASKLLAAQASSGRRTLDVATIVGKKAGDNPHFWYGPNYVFKVIDSITATYESVEPAEKAYFASRHAALEQHLSAYRQQLAYLAQHFEGARVGATESIFQYMAQYLHLDLVTPYAFMKAVAEGTDPPASAIATFDRQIAAKAFGVLVYNVQTVTPLTTSIKAQAAKRHIAAVGVSETIQPPTLSFQAWMVRELQHLRQTLAATKAGSG